VETARVQYFEPPSIKVGKWLIEKGYGLADLGGLRLSSLECRKHLGVLGPAVTKRVFFGLITTYERSPFFGTITFESEGPWDFEIYGRENVEKLTALANEMAEKFKVEIALHLVSEEPRLESFNLD